MFLHNVVYIRGRITPVLILVNGNFWHRMKRTSKFQWAHCCLIRRYLCLILHKKMKLVPPLLSSIASWYWGHKIRPAASIAIFKPDVDVFTFFACHLIHSFLPVSLTFWCRLELNHFVALSSSRASYSLTSLSRFSFRNNFPFFSVNFQQAFAE